MDDERLKTLKDWMSRDRDIKSVVHAAVDATGCDTVDQLHAEQPDVFGEVFDCIAAMIEDIPIHEPPGFSR